MGWEQLNFGGLGMEVLLAILGGVLAIVFFIDVSQTEDAVRRNFPVLGHLRYILSGLGVFFRQYFFAMDREELPFNRAVRRWIEKVSAGEDGTVPFGSTLELTGPGAVIFVNAPFPVQEAEREPPLPVIFGPSCALPYMTSSIFNISGMSYGALSAAAVQALSRGAALAGCWLNTGEGGLSRYHLERDCDLVFQIGTAKYGVRTRRGELDWQRLRMLALRPQIKMFEIKLSQGAKPGHGGILPAEKVTPEIAAIRGIPPYRASLSPERHSEIGTVGELCHMIVAMREVTGKPVGLEQFA